MNSAISQLRQMCQAGTADYTVAGTTFWTDDQIQGILDAYRSDFKETLTIKASYAGAGTTEYRNYYFYTSEGYAVEEATSGSDAWRVETTNGAEIGTANYTANYSAGHLLFSADQGGSVYVLRGRRYDVFRAAAQLCKRKAASYAADFDIQSDNHDLKRSQRVKHFTDLAKQYESLAPATMARLIRTDVTWDGGK